MVAIIFSMLSEGCSKLTIYTECWNPSFLKELAAVLSFLNNLWLWLYLNFLFCHRSHIYWAWNCETQVWNRSLVSALVTVVYKDESCVQQGKFVNISPRSCESRLAPENSPVYSAVTAVQPDCGWHAECCTLIHLFKSLQVKCSLFSCFCFAWQRGCFILPRVKKYLWTFPKSTGLMASAPCMSWAVWCFPKWFYLVNLVLGSGMKEQDGSFFTNAFQWPDWNLLGINNLCCLDC